MRKRTAWLTMGIGLVLILAADFFVVTSRAGLSRLAGIELDNIFGDTLEYSKVRASLDGLVVLKDVALHTPGRTIRPLSVARVEIQLGEGYWPQKISLTEPRLTLSDALVRELSRAAGGGGGPPLRETIPADRLPAVVCRGGTVEADFADLFAADRSLVLSIREILFTPLGEYRYYVSGTLEHPLLGSWRARGEVDLGAESMELEIACQGVTLDGRVRDMFSEEARRVWDKYLPEGCCDLRVSLAKQKGHPLDFRATLVARGMSLYYRNFPYHVDGVEGEIDFLVDSFRIKHMTGRHGTTRISFDGSATGYESDAGYTFRVEVEDMPLDADLYSALKEDACRVWDAFEPTGRLDARGVVVREAGPDRPEKIPLDITVRDATLRYREFPYILKYVSGDLHMDGETVDIKGVVSREGGATVTLTGRVEDLTGDPSVDLTIDARGLPLDARLREALPQETQETWDQFSPGGAIDVCWRVRKAKAEKEIHSAVARARGNTVTYKDVPLLVRDVEGEVELEPSGLVRLRHVTGQAHGAAVTAHGEATKGLVSLQLDATGLSLDDEVKAALPGGLGEFIRMSCLNGVVDFKAGLSLREGGEKKVELDLKIAKGVIETEPKFEDLLGQVALVGYFDAEPTFLGCLNLSSAVAAGKRVSDLSVSFNSKGKKVNFVNLRASAYGGIVTAPSLSVDADTKEFRGSFAVDRLDIREYSMDTQSYSDKTLSGKASLDLPEIAGRAGDRKSIVGKGRLAIQDGYLWDIPIFLSLFTLNPQDLFKSKNQFDSGIIEFEVGDGAFQIPALAFSSENVSVLGRGRIDFDGNLNLMLRTETGFFGLDLPFIKLVTGTFDALKGAFHGVEIVGTFDKPETRQKFFPGLRD